VSLGKTPVTTIIS